MGDGLAKATVEILNWWFHMGGYPSLAATLGVMCLKPTFRHIFSTVAKDWDDVGSTVSQLKLLLKKKAKIHKDKVVD